MFGKRGVEVAIGDKIRNIRMKRDMAQKELGLAIGFNERTADVRMAQYESGTRVPKEAIIVKIAENLKVNANYLMAPAIDKPEGENLKRIKLSLTYLDNYLKEWHQKKKELDNDKITQEEYYNWKVNWLDSSRKFREEYCG